MVTVRTYWNPAKAALAKSVLDNYEIPCALLDEHANLSARGAQFAVPTRLVVDEAYATRAMHILNGDLESAAKIEVEENALETPINGACEIANRNPWELLVLAFYLLVPAICVLRTKFPTLATGSRARYFIARATATQFLSWLVVSFAVVLVVFYFRVRHSSLKSSTRQ
ncbi:MAG TPA: DUF2007 domain-containing protein [Chthoniobacterales bacterium]|nr:DUF2007 domain-containing protein [Chthoniobacterales bacterium]